MDFTCAKAFAKSAIFTVLAGFALTMPQAATAQSVEFGKTLFMQNCASCHGPDGAGDGPLAV